MPRTLLQSVSALLQSRVKQAGRDSLQDRLDVLEIDARQEATIFP